MPPQQPRTGSAQPDCDVLVLGAGLAGMRAAWAAKQAEPRLRVTLVSPRAAPSGSSFANRNNALGMQAPQEHEVQAFVDEVLRLAPPGLALPELVRALAQDAPARLDDLLDLGLCFRRQSDGSLSRFPGCFSPRPRAVIFDGLASAHAAFSSKLRTLGVTVVQGFEALELLRDDRKIGGRVCGAKLCALRGGKPLTLTARAVIAALGGPGPLYARRISGPGGSGLAYGLLRQAGARLVNTNYLQFFWLRARDRSFVNPGDLAWPKDLAHLAADRRGHCPMACGLPDAALDLELLARRDGAGKVHVPGQEPLALAAHAGNGGALIDEMGRTSVPGLYACGECAGGMHGANRLGGAMVLSALVFGARAGAAAAKEAANGEAANGEMWPCHAPDHGQTCAGTIRQAQSPLHHAASPDITTGRSPDITPAWTPAKDAAFLARLRRGMDRHGLPGPQASGREGFIFWLKNAGAQADAGQRQRLLALSALAVLEDAPRP